MKPRRILVFPGATEIGLEIQRALCQCREVVLSSAGADPPGHAPFIFRRHHPVASVHEAGWIDELNAVIEAEGVDYILPAHDDVIVALAKNVDRIRARVVSSPPRTCLITRSKSETYRLFDGVLRVPGMFRDVESVTTYPVFVKPDRGQGSRGATVARDRDELLAALAGDPTALILEYLPGREYTVDCFSDRERGILFCCGRERIRTRNGISMNSVPVDDPRFRRIAEQIIGKLELHGVWFYQVRMDARGDPCLLEIAPRVSGTMALNRVRGVNFPLLSIYELERIPVEILCNDIGVEIDRALTNRYRHDLKFKNVYVDLDNTLIRSGRVNVRLVAFLYQCINTGIRLTLITKSAEKLEGFLVSHRIGQIFDEIIQLEPSAEKAERVTEAASIFIDDSFRERAAVRSRRGIPTFDGSMIEMLLDEREW